MEFKNRFGETYFLQEGTTAIGKSRYFVGRTLTAKPLDTLPVGFELYEMPKHGRVVLRRTRPRSINESEISVLTDAIRGSAGLRYFIVDIQNDNLIVYLPQNRESRVDDLLEVLPIATGRPLPYPLAEARDIWMKHCYYEEHLRLELVDADQRLFLAFRWDWSEDVDDWVFLTGPKPLMDLVDKYVCQLGQESFDELKE